MGAMGDPALHHGLGHHHQLLGLVLLPTLHSRLAGHGVQKAVPLGGGIHRRAGAVALGQLLQGGGDVLIGQKVRGGAHHQVAAAEVLQLEAQLRKLSGALQKLGAVLRDGPPDQRLQKLLAHGADILGLQRVEAHALVGGVLVDEEDLVPLLYDDIGAQDLAHHPPGGLLRLRRQRRLRLRGLLYGRRRRARGRGDGQGGLPGRFRLLLRKRRQTGPNDRGGLDGPDVLRGPHRRPGLHRLSGGGLEHQPVARGDGGLLRRSCRDGLGALRRRGGPDPLGHRGSLEPGTILGPL